MGDEWTYV